MKYGASIGLKFYGTFTFGGEDSTDGSEGGKGSTGEGDTPKAKTDDAFGKSLKDARDKNAETVCYAKIPDLDLDKVIVPYKKVLANLNAYYSGEASGHASVDTSTDLYIKSCKKEVDELKADSKKFQITESGIVVIPKGAKVD